MPSLLGRYRPPTPPGMGPAFDQEDDSADFNGTRALTDADRAKRQADPQSPMPPPPPPQGSSTAPSSFGPRAKPNNPGEQEPPPPTNTPQPPSAASQPPPMMAPPPQGPQSDTADKLMDDFAKEGTGRPEAPKDNIWQRIARVATTALGADPDRQQALLHPKYTAQRNRYDQGIQDAANAQTLADKSEDIQSRVAARNETAEARTSKAATDAANERDKTAGKAEERKLKRLAEDSKIIHDMGGVIQPKDAPVAPGFAVIPHPFDDKLVYAIPPAAKTEMRQVDDPEMAKILGVKPGEKVSHDYYLKGVELRIAQAKNQDALASREMEGDKNRQNRQDVITLAASLKPPRPVPDSAVRRGESRKVKSIASRILSDTIDQGGSPQDAITNAQKFYRDDPDVSDYRSDVVEELQRMAINQGKVDHPPGSGSKKAPPFIIQDGKIVAGAAPAQKPNTAPPPQVKPQQPASAPQQRLQQAQQQPAPKQNQQAPLAASKKPFPRSHLAGFAAQNHMPPQQAEQLLAQQGYVLQ